MDENESALGRVPIPFQTLAYGVDLRGPLRAPLETAFVGHRKPWHVILIQDPAALNGVGSIVPDLKDHDARYAVATSGNRSAQGQLGPLVTGCYDSTSSLACTAHARQQSAGPFPDPATSARIRELLAIPAQAIPFSVTTFAGSLCEEITATACAGLLHTESGG
jgi:hypothetical protein